MMLGDAFALAVQQPGAALAQPANHRAGRVCHVAVERRAEEGEAAGYGWLHIRTEPKFSPRHLRHAGKTTQSSSASNAPSLPPARSIAVSRTTSWQSLRKYCSRLRKSRGSLAQAPPRHGSSSSSATPRGACDGEAGHQHGCPLLTVGLATISLV